MNIRIAALAFLLVFVVLVTASQVKAQKFSPQHEKVKLLFQSDEEKTAKDAVWTAQDIFKVGVFDDGTNRNGYADYVCQVLYDYGFKGKNVWVQIIDIGKLHRTGKWVKLGESHCE